MTRTGPDFEAKLWGSWIQWWRGRNHLTQRGVADLLKQHDHRNSGVTGHAVGRWERGDVIPSPWYRQQLTMLWGTPPWLREDDMIRRQFLAWVSKAGIGAAVGATGTGGAGGVGSRDDTPLPGAFVDLGPIGYFESQLIMLERFEPQVASPILLPNVRGLLDTVTQLLLHHSLQPAVRRQLTSIAGEAAVLAGYLEWNLDQSFAANEYFLQALRAAQEAEDPALGALVLGWMTFRPAYRENPADRLGFLRDGIAGFRPSDATRITRAWLSVRQAEAHAALGQSDDCLRALDQVQEILADRNGDDAVSHRPRASSPAFPAEVDITTDLGRCLVLLGKGQEGERVLKHALNGIAGEIPKLRNWLLPSLALACAQQEKLDEAGRQATEALEGATTTHAHVNLEMVLQLRRDFEPYATHPAIRQFYEEVRARGFTTGLA